jgi:hypothetical protein
MRKETQSVLRQIIADCETALFHDRDCAVLFALDEDKSADISTLAVGTIHRQAGLLKILQCQVDHGIFQFVKSNATEAVPPFAPKQEEVIEE